MSKDRKNEQSMTQLLNKTHIDFAGKFSLAAIFSSVMILGFLGLIIFKGLQLGVDFRGGAEVQVKFKNPIDLGELRKILSEKGHKGASVQSIGASEENEYLIRVSGEEGNLNAVSTMLSQALSEKFADKGVEIRKTDIVGPKAGEELRNSGLKAMIYAILAITIYIGLRFDFKYAPGAIVALFHDVIFTIGLFALTGKEFNLQIVAAILAIIGYSVNDTVVIYDRVRENESLQLGTPLKNILNRAINETLSRTILTSGSTLLVCLSMLIWGGPVIRDFFFAITAGVIIGTYSTIYVAVPLTMFFDKFKKKEGLAS